MPGLLMDDGYDPIDYVSRIAPRPLFILQGTEDRIVPAEMAEKLCAAAHEPKTLWLVEGADHYQALDEFGEIARPRLLAFFARCVDRNAIPSPSDSR